MNIPTEPTLDDYEEATPGNNAFWCYLKKLHETLLFISEINHPSIILMITPWTGFSEIITPNCSH